MITIIYAYRNRDVARVNATLASLQLQTQQNFNVVFVDYGSEKKYAVEVKKVISGFDFASYYYVAHPRLLWNKSKALNYGIKQTDSPYIFIADVDLIFHPDTMQLFKKLACEDKFFLFNLGHLDKTESEKLTNNYNFEDLRPTGVGKVNGMILAPKQAFLSVNGLDEFFHFYGSEDEDLFARMENAGYEKEANAAAYFNHYWHKTFAGSEDKVITQNPRVKNIMRINQRHFLRNREKGIKKPIRQGSWGNVINKEESDLLQIPTKIVKIYNILSHVEHFIGEELPSFTGEIVKVEFVEDPYYHTLKHKVKKVLGKQTQPYCSLKEVNDRVLKEIVYNYRDANYSFEISNDLKSFIFKIQL